MVFDVVLVLFFCALTVIICEMKVVCESVGKYG